MNKIYFLVIVLAAFCLDLKGQDDCCNAFPLSGPGQMFVGSSSGNGNFEAVSACSCLATDEHDSYWFVFDCVASGTFEMMITPDMLSADFDFAIYEGGCPCDNHNDVVACDYTGPITPPGPFVPTGISSDPMGTFGVPGATEFIPTISLTGGETYYILCDNITTNGAGFDIQFAGSAQMGPPSNFGPPPPPTPITGDLTPCPGIPFNYSVPNNPNYEYEWTTDPMGPGINGNPNNFIDVTWDQVGVYTLCVTADDGCNMSPPSCEVVVVTQPIGPLIEDIICIGGTYEAPDGQTFYDPGLHEMIFEDPQGCDSIVPLLLDGAPVQFTILVEELCDGDCFEFAGETYCQTGIYEEILETFQGCDSTVVLNLIVIPNQANIIVSGSVSCNGIPVILDGSTSIGGNNMTFEWVDPNGLVVGFDPTLLVTEPGIYTLNITSEVGANICTDSETALVEGDNDPPENITADGGTITCTLSSVDLMGNSTTPGVTYEWSGPGGFSSTDQNPNTSATGVYNLIVTAPNGCTGEETAVVDGDSNVPTAGAEGDTINCTNNNGILTGNSNTPGVTYAWTGPGGFASSDQNPSASAPGTYNLVVTASNGCSAQASALLLEDNAQPDVSAAGASIDCINPMADIMGNSTTPNVTYAWIGPGGFSSSDQNPTVNTGGTYTLTVSATNGCTSTATAEVDQNAALPDASATGGEVDCAEPDLMLMGSSTTGGVTYTWIGPGGFTSSDQNPEVTGPGAYTLTVTATNGCTSTAAATVTQDIAMPDASAAGGTVTCATGNVALAGNSNTAGVTYSWTGPGGNIFNEQNPTVSQIGTYTLTVTAANGCTMTATADVEQDAGVPDVGAIGGTLTCINGMVTITGSSMTAGVTYSWTGPGGFTSTGTSETVSESGDYILTVTAPNNCTSQAVAFVELDDALPDFTVQGGTISCGESDIELSSTVNTPGSTFEWTGPSGFTSTEANPTVGEAGNYILTVTGPNGCDSDETAIVMEDAAIPDVSALGGTIDCITPVLPLQGGSNTAGVLFEWTGPNGFITDVLDTSVIEAGDYVLTVTAANGCTSTATAAVLLDNATPADVDAVGGILSCTADDLMLMGSTSTANVSYSWTGPGGFTSIEQNPLITEAGSYLLTVTSQNGCTATDQAVVGQDANAPQADAVGATLTCTELMVQITGNSTSQGVSYSWTGPNGFISDEQSPMVEEGGNYILEVTAPNGCVTQASAQVNQDIAEPENVEAIGGTLTCTSGLLEITGSSTTANVTYSWTGPGGFTSDQPNTDVTVSGTYTLVVTGPNGCTSITTAEVENDSNAPTATANGGELTCTQPDISLNGQSNTGIDFEWTGPNGFTSAEANPNVSEGGTYILVVTSANGCSNTIEVDITVNQDEPQATADGGMITCQLPEIFLQGNSPTVGVTFEWTGPGGYMSDEQFPEVSVGGTYTLTVTGANGCTSTASAVVDVDADVPTATAAGGTIDCNVLDVQLDGSSDQTVTDWFWIGPNGFTSTEQNPTVTEQGSYTLTITTGNGCSASANALVDENTTDPIVVIETPPSLTCDVQTVVLDASGSDSGTTFSITWTTTNGNILNGQNTLMPEVNSTGTYILAIINNDNGCSANTDVTVDVVGDTPVGSTLMIDDEFCFGENAGFVSVEAVDGGTAPYLYALNGGALGTENTFTGLAPGSYQILIQDALGCEFIETFEITTPADLQLGLDALGLGVSSVPLGQTIQLVTTLNISAADVASVVWTPAGIADGCADPCLNLTLTPNQTQEYTVTVTDINGCFATAAILIPVDKSRPVFVPNAFSPNHDGINDNLVLFGSQSVDKIKSFMIFSRWGETVYQGFNLPHSDFDYAWDGTYRGKIMDAGVFTWFAEVEFKDGEVEIFAGDVTLIR